MPIAFHAGEFLKEIFDELPMSQAKFARVVGVSPMRISHVINGSRPVTAELALLFGKAFGQSPEYWLNLHGAYDLALARKAIGKQLNSIKGGCLIEASSWRWLRRHALAQPHANKSKPPLKRGAANAGWVAVQSTTLHP